VILRSDVHPFALYPISTTHESVLFDRLDSEWDDYAPEQTTFPKCPHTSPLWPMAKIRSERTLATPECLVLDSLDGVGYNNVMNRC
jgi:hypothetical protein